MKYICPVCQQGLSLDNKSWRCIEGHSYDCAKEGYVNLLPINKKKSKDPGDNKEMMHARREFLNKGHYQHLSVRINEVAQKWANDAHSILDLGCGEGYYSHRLWQQFKSQKGQINFCGVDISRSAIRYAAKCYKELHVCVASTYELPFANNSFDLAVRVFAPSNVKELQRIIRKDGVLITVSPGKRHHFAIKKMIYAEPRYHSNEGEILDGFEKCYQKNLVSELVLNNPKDIEYFLEMTPYAWKLTRDQKDQLAKSSLTCELDFLIEVHKRR